MTRKVHPLAGVPKPRSVREKIAASLRARNQRVREAMRLQDEFSRRGVLVSSDVAAAIDRIVVVGRKDQQ